jgi:uncharacterized membrane protein YbhN (UPF0104 family)
VERDETVTYIWYMVAGTVAGVAAWGYLARYLYLTKGRWSKSLTGVALVTMGLANALVFSFVGVNLWFTVFTGASNWPGRVQVGTGLFTLLSLAVILVWIAFERAQRK